MIRTIFRNVLDVKLPGQFPVMSYQEAMRLCHKAGFAPQVVQEALQLHIVVSLVSARVGVALVPASTQLLRMEGVVFKPLVGSDASVQIAVASRASDRSPVVREFTEVARQVFSGGLRGLERFR